MRRSREACGIIVCICIFKEAKVNTCDVLLEKITITRLSIERFFKKREGHYFFNIQFISHLTLINIYISIYITSFYFNNLFREILLNLL